MKSAIVFSTLMLFSLPHLLQAQGNCDELKKEVEYLKKTLKILTPTKTISSGKIDFNLLKVEGNTKEQTVNIIMTLVNHDANRNFQFKTTKGIDLEGNEYDFSQMLLGKETYGNTLYTDVPLKCVITLKKVLPTVKMLKLVPVLYYDGEPGHSVTIEFKDLTIDWK